jgi:hypothetical protein
MKNITDAVSHSGRLRNGPPALMIAILLAVSGGGARGSALMDPGEVAAPCVFYVATDGDDTNQGTLEQPFRTIGRGVNAAASGDTVVLRNGTYSGQGNTNLTWNDRNVAIRSESNARDLCVIDCAGVNGFKIFNAIGDGQRHELHLAGLTIANADTAIAVSSVRWYDTPVTVGVANCVIRESVVGLHLSSADLVMDSSSVYGNSVAGIWQSDDENFSIVDCKIRGNGIGIVSGSNTHTIVQLIEATEIVANGRGISWSFGWSDPGLVMRHCRVDSSTAGDGLVVIGYIVPVTLEDCTVRDNAGTGVVERQEIHLSLLRCDVSGNGHSGISWGAGEFTGLKLENVSLVGNHVWGLGLNTDFLTQSEPMGVRDPEPGKQMHRGQVQIINCDIRDNAFGGVSIPGLHDACTIAGTSIVDNGGPGLILDSSPWAPTVGMPLAMNSVTVAGNSGTGIAALSSLWTATGVLIAHNGGLAIDLIGTSTVILTCSDLYANQAGDWTAPIASQLGTNGNLRVDPRFCDTANGDYHLKQNSPLSAANNAECGLIGRFDWNCPPDGWVVPVPNVVPTTLRLYPCQPNPFNPRTAIKYDLPESGPVRLSVFDVAGRLVRTLVDESMPPGGHEAVWDGRDSSGREVGSGSYLARLEFGGKVEIVRMGLVR